jgi:GxxExxY protein
MSMRELDDTTDAIISAAIQIHRDLGPGLLESVYEAVLARALEKRGFHVQRQAMIRFEYDGMVFDGFRGDLIVDHQVIVEVKNLAPVFAKKLLTYIRLADKRVGLLLNFGANTLIEGLRRVVNDLAPSASPRLRVNQSL